MNESIYNLVPMEYSLPPKKPTPKSNHDPLQSIPGSTFGCKGTTRLYGAGVPLKKDGALYGPPKEEYGLTKSSPGKARTLSPGAKSGEPFRYTDSRRPAVPSKDEKPILGITTSKNFITANAVEAILQVPKKREPLELNYLKKEDFGKIPAYLAQVKEEIRRENEMIEKYVKEQMGEIERSPEMFEELMDDERRSLIYDLKEKWASVNTQYQKITHLVRLDTTGQVRRKENLEGMLQQLENDIEKLQRASAVLIRT